jgi:hypothetical protein
MAAAAIRPIGYRDLVRRCSLCGLVFCVAEEIATSHAAHG